MYTEKNRELKNMSWRNLSLKGRLEREPGKATKGGKNAMGSRASKRKNLLGG